MPLSRLLLAIDSSTALASVALADATGVVAGGGGSAAGWLLAEAEDAVTTHSEMLLPMIERVLRQGGCTLAEVGAVVCGAGPGSFTGLRIGLATAKGLCLGAGKPLLMVSSLAALALEAEGELEKVAARRALVVPCLDARKGQVFVGYYLLGPVDGCDRAAGVSGLAADPRRPRPSLLEMAAGEEAVAPEEVLPRIEELRREGQPAFGAAALLLGDGLARLGPPAWPAGSRALGVRPTPRAARLACLAARRLVAADFDDLAGAEPRYLRPSDAELLYARKRQGDGPRVAQRGPRAATKGAARGPR